MSKQEVKETLLKLIVTLIKKVDDADSRLKLIHLRRLIDRLSNETSQYKDPR